jgi:hypothetical protein
MKRLALILGLTVITAAAWPAAADTEVDHCSATQAATASPIIADTAPTCTFELTCSGGALGCAYLITLDSNGTGLVSGAMTAAIVSPSGAANFAFANGTPAPDPSCSGALQCHYASSTENPVLLFVKGAPGEGTAVKITCSGGDLALLESVGCNLSAVEFGPF